MQIYWIDNARFWLETFVISKHLMVYLGTLYRWDTWWQPGVASFFESFMMPMFSCCSGFLSKGDPTPERALRVIFRAWIPFAIINVFYQWIDGARPSPFPQSPKRSKPPARAGLSARARPVPQAAS